MKPSSHGLFSTPHVIEQLRNQLGPDGVGRSITVLDEGNLSVLSVYFNPRRQFLAPDLPADAIRVYGPRAGPLLANGNGGGGLLNAPHVLPYVADRHIPWRFDNDAFAKPFTYLDTDNTLAQPARNVRQMFALRRGMPRQDNHLVMLRGTKRSRAGGELSFGVGSYSSKRDSQETDGSYIAMTEDERARVRSANPDNFDRIVELEGWLTARYPEAKRVRDIMAAHHDGLPPWSGSYSYATGVACVFVTADGFFPVSVRKAGVVSVNAGLNVPASGGVEAALWSNKWHRPGHELLEIAMRNEIRKELGIPDGRYTVRLAGFLRELTRGGSPEFFFTAFFDGTLDEFLRYVVENDDEERKELSGEMKIIPVAEVLAMFQYGAELGRIFHHKLMANIAVSFPHLEEWVRSAA